LLFILVLKNDVRRVRIVKPGWLELSGSHQLLVHSDINILGGSVHTIKKNTEAILVACKETGLDVNADNTKYMVMSPYQNSGRSHRIKTDNSSFETVEHFKRLGTTLTKQNSIQEEIKSRLKSRNAFYHSV
jgi:hypothetical protein